MFYVSLPNQVKLLLFNIFFFGSLPSPKNYDIQRTFYLPPWLHGYMAYQDVCCLNWPITGQSGQFGHLYHWYINHDTADPSFVSPQTQTMIADKKISLLNAGLIRATLSPLKYDSVLGQDLSRNQRCKKDFLEWKLIKDCTIINDNPPLQCHWCYL